MLYLATDGGVTRRATLGLLPLRLALAWTGQPGWRADGGWRARLLSPLSSEFSRKGDLVSLRVLAPEAFAGSGLEGCIRELKPASLQIEFSRLHTPDGELAVAALSAELFNRRREKGVDDLGGAVEVAGRGAAASRKSPPVLRFSFKGSRFLLAAGAELVLQLQRREER
jgi:hypothetical protein